MDMPIAEPCCHACGHPLGTVESLQCELDELHRMNPMTAMSESAYLMVRQLHIAVHGDTWARPESTRQVWLDLLARVAELAKTS